MKSFNLIVENGEDGFFISEVVELPGCHTQAKNMEELLERTKEAIEFYLEGEPNFNISTHFVGVQKIKV